MPKVVIDGKAYEFEGRPMLLQFAMDQGVEIPYFCYHPAMSVPTNCRMCLVEVGYHARNRQTRELMYDGEGNPIIHWGRRAGYKVTEDSIASMRKHKIDEEIISKLSPMKGINYPSEEAFGKALGEHIGEALAEEWHKTLVEFTWGQKPVTACNTPVSPGMFVRTHRTSKTIHRDQQGVLEYMLVNHPLDCPICDQAGECPLQIWTYKYGPEGSRFESVKKHKPKRVELGPNVVLDGERCINCTRCTRFTEEISGSAQLTIINRGDKNYPATAPGEVFDDAYSMNTIDLCPVGALTSRDHRFKARVWEMNHSPTICTGCSKGCNVNVWIRDNKVMRHTPRENQKINQFWMCDEGRLSITHLNDNRVSGTKIKGDIPVDFQDGLNRASKALEGAKKKMFIGSAYASFESNYALRALAKEYGVHAVYYVGHENANWGDEFLRQNDRTPNAAACELLGFKRLSMPELQRLAYNFELVYIMEDDKVLEGLEGVLDNEDITVVAHSHNYTKVSEKVDVLLPAATHLESDGTFVNVDGIPQFVKMTREIRQMTPEMWMRLPKSRLDKAAVWKDNWRNLDNVKDCLPSWIMLSRLAKTNGINLGMENHKRIFGKMKGEFEVLKGMKISYKAPKSAFKSTQFDFAIS